MTLQPFNNDLVPKTEHPQIKVAFGHFAANKAARKVLPPRVEFLVDLERGEFALRAPEPGGQSYVVDQRTGAIAATKLLRHLNPRSGSVYRLERNGHHWFARKIDDALEGAA